MEIFPRISPFGDRTLLLEFSPDINPQTLGAMQVFLQLLASAQIPGLKELIPSYSSLLVGYDPFIWSFPTLSSALREILKQKETSPGPNSPVKRVPVVYGKEYGPDLAYVAQYHKISTAEVVTWHSSTLYRVYAIGGFPGLPAMGIVPKEIETPRLSAPRPKVPPGSVALAGKQTGIYALESPGGWQLIGRTPLNIFDPSRNPPSWFQTGDRVQFYPIPESEFAASRALDGFERI
jgi:inhibitor of KinA